jgi:hypothetical protein
MNECSVKLKEIEENESDGILENSNPKMQQSGVQFGGFVYKFSLLGSTTPFCVA